MAALFQAVGERAKDLNKNAGFMTPQGILAECIIARPIPSGCRQFRGEWRACGEHRNRYFWTVRNAQRCKMITSDGGAEAIGNGGHNDRGYDANPVSRVKQPIPNDSNGYIECT